MNPHHQHHGAEPIGLPLLVTLLWALSLAVGLVTACSAEPTGDKPQKTAADSVVTHQDVTQIDSAEMGSDAASADVTTIDTSKMSDAPATETDATQQSLPQCLGGQTVGKPCQKTCLPGFAGRCTCAGCKCKSTKRTKQTCPGAPGCDCKNHWDCDQGPCVPDEPKPGAHRICAELCVDSCQKDWACTPVTDPCGTQRHICLPKGVTQGNAWNVE
ncbi:MAG: hypothetical protein KC502_18875 [Myxococcales bacterium]|nr:hypothetical protein [Myxococcales bacterium]